MKRIVYYLKLNLNCISPIHSGSLFSTQQYSNDFLEKLFGWKIEKLLVFSQIV